MITIENTPTLPATTATGKIKIAHLQRYWAKAIARRTGKLPHDTLQDEWKTDVTLLSALGLGIEQTAKYLYQENPTFDEFEDWILEVNGGQLSETNINQFNAEVTGSVALGIATHEHVLGEKDLAFWKENGYVILRGAVPREDCEATIQMICDFLELDRNDPATWYKPHPAKQGIMIQLFQHPLLQKNRESKMIRAAYEQLWGRKDIWVNTDRVGFNPPENAHYKFQGTPLHWDVSLELPIPFGTQGILYLSDTQADQGAFTLVPGFQNRIDNWIHSLPAGANPRTQDIYALGAMPVAANAGDFIIWHQALPHGASPNTSTVPRIVQYMNFNPVDPEIRAGWK